MVIFTFLGGLRDITNKNGYVQKKFVPFNPLTRRTEALIENDDGNKFSVTKGALSVVLPLCGTKEDDNHNDMSKSELRRNERICK